jgi:Arc/MetJ-type ribon-helix-helix transcriptional regulator
MNISLTPEVESSVDSRVASGRCQSASEVPFPELARQ